MKVNNKIIKRLIRESISRIIKEEFKGIIGGELEQEADGTYVSKRDDNTGEGQPQVFDSDETNLLAQRFDMFKDPSVRDSLSDQMRKNIGPIPKASSDTQKKIVGRMFTGKKFKSTASWMWGNNAFPGSNVYLIPIAGGKHEAAKLIFGHEAGHTKKDLTYSKQKDKGDASFYEEEGINRNYMTGQDIAIFKNRLVDFETRRHLLFDLQAEGINILTNLGVNIGEISSMNLQNDIVFIPLATGTARNFMSSPHMIIHAIFDTTGERGGTEIDKIINPIQDEMRDLIMSLGISPFRFGDSTVSPYMDAIRTIGTTRAFRDNVIFTSNDMVSELLTQEITNQSPKGYQRGRGGFRPAITHETGASLNRNNLRLLPAKTRKELLNVLNKIKTAAVQVRELLKGKIVIINVL